MTHEMREWGERRTGVACGMEDAPSFSEPKPDKLEAEDVAKALMLAPNQPGSANVPGEVVMSTG